MFHLLTTSTDSHLHLSITINFKASLRRNVVRLGAIETLLLKMLPHCRHEGTLTERGRLSTVDLIVPTSLDQLLLMMQTLFTFLQKQAA
jgi:hypothetical protein